MRIVTRKELLTLPVGTVFAEYEPCIVGDMRIKGENAGTNDWFYQEIDLALDCEDSGEMVELLDASEKTGKSIPMDFDCQSRDGTFNDTQLYAIYEKQDVVKQLIARLTETL